MDPENSLDVTQTGVGWGGPVSFPEKGSPVKSKGVWKSDLN